MQDSRFSEEAKEDVKQLVRDELTTLVEQSLDDILRTFYHNTQYVIWSDVYNVAEQVMLDLLRNKIISEKTINSKFTDNRIIDVNAMSITDTSMDEHHLCRLACQTTLSAYSPTAVLASCHDAGLMKIDTHQNVPEHR